MDMSFRPRLRHCTLITQRDTKALTVIVGDEMFEFQIEAGDILRFLQIKSCMDGRHSTEEIASKLAISHSEVTDVVALFEQMGLLRQPSAEPFVETEAFLRQIASTTRMWTRQIGYHRLFGGLERGEHRREVLIGLMVETYHYVGSASQHIACALEHASSDKDRALLARYLSDEYDHARYYSETLARMGISPALLAQAHPTVGTLSLVQMLCDIGRRSTLAYFCCTSLFETSADRYEKARESLDSIAVHYGFDKNTVDPALEHMRQDIAAGHVSLLESALQGVDRIPQEAAHQAVNAMHDLKHAFDQFHDQILLYYADISNYIPRPKVDYFCL